VPLVELVSAGPHFRQILAIFLKFLQSIFYEKNTLQSGVQFNNWLVLHFHYLNHDDCFCQPFSQIAQCGSEEGLWLRCK
jgi:hypothetical protein